MKKIYFIFFIIFSNSSDSSAALYLIGVDGCSFNPSVHTIQVGDTVQWFYDAATPRTTTSTIVPAGASMWDAPINENSLTYSYIFTIPGTYYYKSNILPTCVAAITVATPSGISNNNSKKGKTLAYPNPVRDKLTIIYPTGMTKLTLLNFEGKLMKLIVLDPSPTQTNIELDLSDLPTGGYLYSFYKGDMLIETSRIVKTR